MRGARSQNAWTSPLCGAVSHGHRGHHLVHLVKAEEQESQATARSTHKERVEDNLDALLGETAC